MKLPAGDTAQNERNRQIEKADRENVKKSRDNYIDGRLFLRDATSSWVEVVPSAGGGGSGDMEKATYDTTNSGVVDNAEAIGGVPAVDVWHTGNLIPMSRPAYDSTASGVVDNAEAIGGVPAANVWHTGNLTPETPLGYSFAVVRNTDAVTNINTAAWTVIPFGGTTIASDADYTLAANSITVNFDGVISVSVVVSQYMASGSAAVGCRITKNGTAVSGVGQSHFLLAGSYPRTSSANVQTPVAVASGDIIRVETKQLWTTGTVVQVVGETQVSIEKRSN